LFDDLVEQAGRDPRDVERAVSLSLSEPWDEVRRNAERQREAGAGYVVCGWPDEGRPRLEEFVEHVLPELRRS
jgi:hypothetical protein